MKKKLVIAISGTPGSGKSTYAKIIAEKLGLRHISSGQLFRKVAEERGLSLVEVHKEAEVDPTLDLAVDEEVFKESLEGGVVLDSHLAGWLLKDVADLKIFLTSPLEVRAERVAKRDGLSFNEALVQTMEIEESNRKRYLKLYGIDVKDLSVFDIVINTSKWSVEEVVNNLINFINFFKSRVEESGG